MENAGKLIQVKEGMTVLAEGELNFDMYKIVKGNAEVYMGYGTENETLIGILGPQSCFGELGMLLEKPAIYTVIAYSDLLLLRITKGEMGDFVQQNHKNIMDIMQRMAQTMMTMRTQIDMLISDLNAGTKPDDVTLHEINKTVGYEMYRNKAMSGKFHMSEELRRKK